MVNEHPFIISKGSVLFISNFNPLSKNYHYTFRMSLIILRFDYNFHLKNIHSNLGYLHFNLNKDRAMVR
jgi:hypothetical protein